MGEVLGFGNTLRQQVSGKLISPPCGLEAHATIDIIIDFISRNLLKELLEGLFVPIDIDWVFNAPISLSVREDKRTWAASADNCFCVHDASWSTHS